MDVQDRRLLNEIQSAFPVESLPYRVIAERIGMNEAEVLARIAHLKERGIIRRVGASINSRRVGFVSTLLAAQVPTEKLDHFVSNINSYQGVTHNYERRHAYNVWFTLIAPSESQKRRTIEEMIHKAFDRMEAYFK